MASTTLGVRFNVIDLDASYEVVGTSDNYSFQYNIGRGSDLVDAAGDSVDKLIALNGNYGDFTVRVFAVSDIGIRSEFIETGIYISPPRFDSTFTFSNLRIANLPEISNVGATDVYTPSGNGDKLIARSEFVDKNIQLQWELIPPPGHAREGEPISTELLNDAFFDHFEVTIKREDGSVLSDAELISGTSLAAELNASPDALPNALSYYRDFKLNIDAGTFDDYDLSRTVSFEIVAYDSFNNTSTGILTGINYEPYLNSFTNSLRGSKHGFSWVSADTDFSNVAVSGFYVPANTNIYSSNSIGQNDEYYNDLLNAQEWRNMPNKVWRQGQNVLDDDGIVYRALVDHTGSGIQTKPSNSQVHWTGLEAPVDYNYFETIVSANSFELSQNFGYDYYYGFQPYDKFGSGENHNLTSEGLSVGGDLQSFTAEIKINNLRFREQKDSLIFDWDVVDGGGNTIDLSEKKFIFTESDVPKLLGISGSLFDIDTNQFLSGVTQGEDSESAVIDDNDIKVKKEGLHNAKVFNNFEYTRAINNAIYGDQGFPSDLTDYNSSTNYSTSSGPDSVIASNSGVYQIKADNNFVVPNVDPVYSLWTSNDTYDVNDVVIYNNKLYKANASFGPGASPPSSPSFFLETEDYSANDLVVAPDSTIRIFDPDSTYYVGNMVMYEGEVYIAKLDQDDPTIPVTQGNNWRIATMFIDYNVAVYKALADVGQSVKQTPIENQSNWELQNPSNSSSFSVYATEFSEDLNYSLNDLILYEDIVYKALQDDPTGEPIFAATNSGGLNDVDYINSHWMPIWERNTNYDDIVFRHSAIPESGKRSVGLELAVLDNNGLVIASDKISAFNLEPSIVDNGFDVDSLSETTKIKFNFNYAFSTKEKTTKVNLYRSETADFEITGSDGLPITEIGGNSPLVKVTPAAADAVFGDNITQIIDEPPIPNIDGIDQITGYFYKILPFDDFGSGDLYSIDNRCLVYPKNYSDKNPQSVPGPVFRTTQDDIPGPVVNFNGQTAFENFFLNWTHPSGGVIDVNNIPNDLSHYEVWKSHQDKLKLGGLTPGPVYLKNEPDPNINLDFGNNKGYRRIDAEISSTNPKDETIPLEKQDPASGITNAEKIFDISANSPTIETSYFGEAGDVNYFWVRAVDKAGNKGPFTGQSQLQGASHEILGLELALQGLEIDATDIAEFEKAITESFGNTVALVPNNPFQNDSAAGEISWVEHYLFNEGTGYIINPPSSGTSDKYVWWDKKDSAGDLNLSLYYFQSGDNNRYLFDPNINDISELNEFSYLDSNDETVTLKGIYFSGVNYSGSSQHPAGSDGNDQIGGFDDGDFIIARNTEGIATPVNVAFANALIGTANIAEASIEDAKIRTLTADKITAGEINGHDIRIRSQGGGDGAIRKYNFTPEDIGVIDPELSNKYNEGFYLSGDGSFGFQSSEGGSLTLDNGNLTLRGNLKQIDGNDYDFVNINVTPSFFNYVENQNAGFDIDAGQEVTFDISFRSSSISDASGIHIKASGVNNNGSTYNIGSGSFVDLSHSSLGSTNDLHYNGDFSATNGVVTASVSLNGDGFDDVLGASIINSGEGFILYVSGENSSTIERAFVGRSIDGREGTSIAEISLFQKFTSVQSNLSAPSSSYTFDFTDQSINIPSSSSWLDSVPSLQNNNDVVYVSKGIAVGTSSDTAASVTWGTPVIYSQKTDGFPGPGTTYRGEWESGETYVAQYDSNGAPIRGDIVKAPSAAADPNRWYICISQHNSIGNTNGKSNTSDVAGLFKSDGTLNTTYWKEFGGNFESIATNLLLTEEAFITQSLTIGELNDQGVIKSNGFIGGLYDTTTSSNKNNWAPPSSDEYNPAGFLLARDDTGATDNVYFDVGGELQLGGNTNTAIDSYIRFSSSQGKLEISAAKFDGSINFTPNSTSDFTATGLLNYDAVDDITTFIGGGYNNTVSSITINSNTYNSVGCAIIAGAENTVSAAFSMIGAGYSNDCNDNYSFIAGGYSNKFESTDDTNGANFIGAGELNTINGGSNQAIMGGDFNTIEYDPPFRYYYGQYGKFVASDDNYLIGGFGFGIGEEWDPDKDYNQNDIVYISIDRSQIASSNSLNDYFDSTYQQNKLYKKKNTASASIPPPNPSSTHTEWELLSDFQSYAATQWISSSWMCDSIYIAGSISSSTNSGFPFYDGRFPVKRTVGWCYIVDILGSNQSGWGYVVLGGTRQNPDAWVYFSTSFTAIDGTTLSSTTVSGWLWFTASITNKYGFSNTTPNSSTTPANYFYEQNNSRWCYLT